MHRTEWSGRKIDPLGVAKLIRGLCRKQNNTIQEQFESTTTKADTNGTSAKLFESTTEQNFESQLNTMTGYLEKP